MKTLLLLIGITFCSFQFANAQETSAPLKDAVENEFKPEAPSSNHTWIKGHWQYNAGRYYWIDGAYVATVKNHTWIDGKWVKNQTTDKYIYQAGYWSQESQESDEIVFNGKTYKAGISNQGIAEMSDSQILLSSN